MTIKHERKIAMTERDKRKRYLHFKLPRTRKHTDNETQQETYDMNEKSKRREDKSKPTWNDTQKKSRDAFQLKGLRQILKIQTTYGQMESDLDRTNRNDNVFKLANSFFDSKKNVRNYFNSCTIIQSYQ